MSSAWLFVLEISCSSNEGMRKSDFQKLDNYLWEIPKYFHSDMRVPVRAYVSEEMLEDALKDDLLD